MKRLSKLSFQFSILTIATSIASTGFAQEPFEICGGTPSLDAFVGAYTVSLGSALLTDGSKILPLKADNSFEATFVNIDNQLSMESGPTSILFQLAGQNEPDWQFDPMEDLALSSDDFEFVIGCEISNLPRLIGSGTSQSQEGTPISFTYRLIAWSKNSDQDIDELLGSLKWSGDGMSLSRVVKMSRN